jgi:hypothetical protein
VQERCDVSVGHARRLQVMARAAAASAAVPNYSAMGATQSWDRKSFRSGEELHAMLTTNKN